MAVFVLFRPIGAVIDWGMDRVGYRSDLCRKGLVTLSPLIAAIERKGIE